MLTKLIVIVMAFCLSFIDVQATSSGLEVTLCDAKSSLWGCNPANWPMGNRKACSTVVTEGNIMSWSSRPIISQDYRVTIGTDENTPESTYVPGQWMEVHVRVLKYGMRYRGLMIYAKDQTGKHVGEWDFVDEDPELFRHPPMFCPNTVLHAGGIQKPYHVLMKWKAPPAGTGKVTFEALIKYGWANEGEFFWPMADPTLNENTNPPQQKWFLANDGETCHQVCAQEGRKCDTAELTNNAVDSADKFRNVLGGLATCKPPYLVDCDKTANVGPVVTEDKHCFYSSSALCQADGKTYTPANCNDVPTPGSKTGRFCPCEDAITSPTPEPTMPITQPPTQYANPPTNQGQAPSAYATNPPTGQGQAPTWQQQGQAPTDPQQCGPLDFGKLGCPCRSGTSQQCDGTARCGSVGLNGDRVCIDVLYQQDGLSPAAPRASLAASLAFLPAVAAVFGRSWSVALVLALAFAVVMPGAQAHNWMDTLSRSVGASTTSPCKAFQGPDPHMEVGPGQIFPLQWMCGHGSPTYMVIVKASDAVKMNQHSENMIDNYISQAPVDLHAQDPVWHKLHRKKGTANAAGGGGLSNAGTNNYFARVVPAGDPLYIEWERVSGKDGDNWMAPLEYKAAQKVDDRRVEYTNPQWPWICGAGKYELSSRRSSEVDVVRGRIPAQCETNTPEMFIVQYLWRGYRDCTDVRFFPTSQVSNIYGTPNQGTTYARIDHCQFEEPRQSFGTNRCPLLDLTNPDISQCEANCGAAAACEGINVVPAKNPLTVYGGFRDSAINLPIGQGSCTTGSLANAQPGQLACYALQPREISNDPPVEAFTTAVDPDDPIFYSTCYIKLQGRIWQAAANAADKVIDVSWRFRDRCIDCDDIAALKDSANVPMWNLIDTCRDCDA